MIKPFLIAIHSRGWAAVLTVLATRTSSLLCMQSRATGRYQSPLRTGIKTHSPNTLGRIATSVCPFGLQDALTRFQGTLDIILSGVHWQTCLFYPGDEIILSQDAKDHVQHVDKVLQLVKQAVVTLKEKKLWGFQLRVNYLGHIVMPSKISIAADGNKEHSWCCVYQRYYTTQVQLCNISLTSA